jgi:hypothetical protein
MKNIGDKLMKLCTGKQKSWSKKSSTTVIFPYKIFSAFTVPRYEIRYEICYESVTSPLRIRHEILPQIRYEKKNKN